MVTVIDSAGQEATFADSNVGSLVTLGTVLDGMQSFVPFEEDDQFAYRLYNVDDVSEWQVGLARMDTSGASGVFEILSITASSNAGAAVTWGAGTKAAVATIYAATFNQLFNLLTLDLVTAGDLGAYVTSANLTTTLADYVTSTSLTSTLADYVTDSDLTTALSTYATDAEVATLLSDYVTSAALTTTLSSYATDAEVSTLLADYVTLTGAQTLTNKTLTAPNLNTSATLTLDALGTSQSNTGGFVLANTTAAAAGAQQISPPVHWIGRGWKTDATAASQVVEWTADVLPVQGTANPTSQWRLRSQVNNGGYATKVVFNSDAGAVAFQSGGLQVQGAGGVAGGISLTGSPTTAGFLTVGPGTQFYSSTPGPSTGGAIFTFNGTGSSATSGEVKEVRIVSSFTPASGSAQYAAIQIEPTINQTAPAAFGAVRGIFIRPAIVSAYDLRALEIDVSTTTHYAIYQGGANAKNYLNGSVGIGVVPGADKLAVTGSVRAIGTAVIAPSDTATNTVTNALTLGHNSSNTPAAGYGAGVLTMLKSSTTNDRHASLIETLWNTATDAGAIPDLVLSAYYNASGTTTKREGLRIRGGSSATLMGFFGATPTAKPTISGSRGGNAALASLLTELATLGLITDGTSA